MGCDISMLKKHKFDSKDFIEQKILFLGLDNAGKTSILFQMRDKEFIETVPTVGLNVENIQFKRYNLTLWDVSGQATRLWKHYFDKIDGIIFVIDSADTDKMIFAKDEFKKMVNEESLLGVPILVMCNKSDLGDKCQTKEVISVKLDLETVQKEREVSVQECSALNGSGIVEGLDRLILMFEERNQQPSQDKNKGPQESEGVSNKDTKSTSPRQNKK